MRCLVTSARPYDREFLEAANQGRHELVFTESPLQARTAFMAQDFRAVCPFVDDRLDEATLQTLARLGTRLAELHFRDHCDDVICDDTFERLLTFPNVIVTGHQAFFTREALQTIAATTIQNLSDYSEGRANGNEVRAQ